jgi:acetylornithine/succinyldiaminopimelate/putrescine aminotransferase
VAGAFVPGTHASTFGGGPVIAAAALAALGQLSQPDFLTAVREKGEYLGSKLKEFKARFPVIQEVRGLGLMWGLELAKEGAPLVATCREKGLLVNCTQNTIIRLLPPLTIEQPETDQALTILASAFQENFP